MSFKTRANWPKNAELLDCARNTICFYLTLSEVTCDETVKSQIFRQSSIVVCVCIYVCTLVLTKFSIMYVNAVYLIYKVMLLRPNDVCIFLWFESSIITLTYMVHKTYDMIRPIVHHHDFTTTNHNNFRISEVAPRRPQDPIRYTSRVPFYIRYTYVQMTSHNNSPV